MYIGMARVRSHVSAYSAAPPYLPGNNKLSLKNTLLGSTDPPIAQAMPFRLIDIFAFPLEQFFLKRDIPIFSSPSFFFFIFFLNHRSSALRKPRKGLIFTPNISTGDGGVHRHQAIVPFLLYDTTTKSQGLQLYITERCHFTTATLFRVRALQVYSADHTCCGQSPFPSLRLLAASTAT